VIAAETGEYAASAVVRDRRRTFFEPLATGRHSQVMKTRSTPLPLILTACVLACGGNDGASATDDGADSSGADSSDDAGDDLPSTSTDGGGDADGSTSGGDADGDGSTSAGDADGSTSAGDASTGESGDDGTTGAAVVPEVIESSPADGEAGVLEDAAIVVHFSVPMDKAATQLAYQSTDVPAGDVTFAWNAVGDELTVTPNQPLAYAMGTDPAATDAIAFSFSITTTAESVDGEPLAQDYVASFTTLRRIDQAFTHDPALTGKATDLGDKAQNSNLGDYPDNDTSRYFISYDLTTMAAGVVDVEVAELTVVRNAMVSGNPFVTLGGVAYQKVAFAEFSQAVFDEPGVGPAAYVLGSLDMTENTVLVTSHAEDVLADASTFEGRLQFRLMWAPDESDGDGSYDTITLLPSEMGLRVQYLAP
jgi:hypothetical protein